MFEARGETFGAEEVTCIALAKEICGLRVVAWGAEAILVDLGGCFAPCGRRVSRFQLRRTTLSLGTRVEKRGPAIGERGTDRAQAPKFRGILPWLTIALGAVENPRFWANRPSQFAARTTSSEREKERDGRGGGPAGPASDRRSRFPGRGRQGG